jgi:RNA-directed DNA polymerase
LNNGVSWPSPESARERVLGIQHKLHKWSTDDQDRRFNDLHNLVCDPATLTLAWMRVRANRGSRSAGVDGSTAYHIEQSLGVQEFLASIREELRSGTFRPLPVKERLIPKRGGGKKFRRLGVPTVRDRVVQAALKLVLEPIFEADFQPCSYGFRPGRRAQDAIAEIHYLTTRSYEWVVEADIKACFDELSHSAILARVRQRVADKRVLSLIKAFLKAGIMSEQGRLLGTVTGTPQGGILSPLMANVALNTLDEHFARAWEAMGADQGQRQRRRMRGESTYRLVRYADDCVPRTQKEELSRSRVRRMWCCMGDDGAWPGGRVARRGRRAGGGRKPPRGASVKSRGAERRGKGVLSARQVWITKASESEPPMKCRKRIDDIRNRGRVIAPGAAWREPVDWPGGCPAWMVARA